MKKTLFSLALCSVFLFATAASALAVPLNFKLTAKVPFDFQIGNKKFPKGEYVIESVNQTGLLLIRNSKGKKPMNFNAIPDKQNEKMKTRLSFRRYGEQYFLHKLWDGQDTIFQLEKSSAEKKAAKMIKGKEDAEGDEVPVSN